MRFEGTQCLRSCFCFFIFSLLLLAFAPACAWAETYFEFKGQKIYYENGEYKEIIDAQTGDTIPVLIFREDGWFKPTKTANGRALVVGGGGAGGYGSATPMNPGGGGGNVIDQEDLRYLADEKHTVTVGAGGPQKTAAGNGGDGQPSKIATETTILVNALGGGGGGSNKAGNGDATVATGGGGSGNGKLGGVGALGNDYRGGKAGFAQRSGGGGGGNVKLEFLFPFPRLRRRGRPRRKRRYRSRRRRS